MLKGLDGKVAVVTGGASGIGEATVRRLVGEGASVILSDRDRERADALASELGAAVQTVIGDVSEEAHADDWRRAALDRFGRLDYLVNNAAIPGPQAPLADTPLDGFDNLFGVNLRGVFIGTKAAMRHLRDHGGGAIVNVGALAGLLGFRNIGSYVAMKHGVVGLSKVAAAEGASHRIRVNVVNPGFTLTPMNFRIMANMGEEMLERFSALQPLGRGAEPSETAAAITWLLSDEASYVSGAIVNVDGAFAACQV